MRWAARSSSDRQSCLRELIEAISLRPLGHLGACLPEECVQLSVKSATAFVAAGAIVEHRGPGQFSVDLEETDVHPIHLDHASAHEPVKESLQLIIFATDNLPVELPAVNSRLAAQDDHERLARLPRLGLALGQAGEPAIPGRIAAFALTLLRQGGRRGHSGDAKNQKPQ